MPDFSMGLRAHPVDRGARVFNARKLAALRINLLPRRLRDPDYALHDAVPAQWHSGAMGNRLDDGAGQKHARLVRDLSCALWLDSCGCFLWLSQQRVRTGEVVLPGRNRPAPPRGEYGSQPTALSGQDFF